MSAALAKAPIAIAGGTAAGTRLALTLNLDIGSLRLSVPLPTDTALDDSVGLPRGPVPALPGHHNRAGEHRSNSSAGHQLQAVAGERGNAAIDHVHDVAGAVALEQA